MNIKKIIIPTAALAILAGLSLLSVRASDLPQNPAQGSSWVRDFLKQNPEYASMEIAGRTESSITFKNKDGKLITQIVDFPIHYIDEKGEWQPLDTTLVYYPETDEWGAPGFNTLIKNDGTVRIIDDRSNTIHTQKTIGFGTLNDDTKEFTSLGQFKEGSARGDTLIRSISAIEHKIKMTDLGIKEELILLSAPAGISSDDLVVMETELGSKQLFSDGWLGDATIAGYQFPAPHGWDADGKELPLKRYARFADGKQYVYTGILGSSLAGVVYPVTIDPDYLDSTNDGYIQGVSAAYATAHSTSTAFYAGTNYSQVGQSLDTGVFLVWRTFLKFDTSAIPDTDIVTQVNLKMVCLFNFSGTDFDIQIVKQDWSAQDPLSAANREAAYDNCLAGTADNNIWRNTNLMAENTQYASGNLNTAWINKTGSTYYSLRSSRDYAGTQPTGLEYIMLVSQEHATVAYRPILTVVHVPPPDSPHTFFGFIKFLGNILLK